MDDNQELVDTEDVQVSNSKQNDVKKEAAKKIGKEVAKKLKSSSLLKAIGPILIKIGIIVIIILLIIGIAMFFVSMPGMAMEKLKQISRDIGSAIARYFGADSTTQLTEEDVYEVLDYIEEMGYDLKGMGFLTDYVGSADDGVERNDEGKINEAKSDFITAYLVSDNYVYTLKNDNIVTVGENKRMACKSCSRNNYWSFKVL